MELPSTYLFRGWKIRYNVAKLTGTQPGSETGPSQTKSVVFVHGTPWSSVVFKPVIEALLAKDSYQVLVYDLPGYGQSQDFDAGAHQTVSQNDFLGDTSVKFQAEALAGLLKHEKLDGVGSNPAPAVIAHDIAGTIALRAHLLLGCDFDTMMLVDANTVLPWGDGFYTTVRAEPQSFLKLPPKIFEAVVRAVTQSACHDPNVLKAGWEDALAQPWIAQANDTDVAEMLEGNSYERIRCDVKVVWGEEDQWIPRHKVEDFIARSKGRVKETTFIPEAGHLVMLDQPARFAIEIFDWFTRFGSNQSLIKF
jgi:pimeloyl-ACP methyl ester carboxylesterase